MIAALPSDWHDMKWHEDNEKRLREKKELWDTSTRLSRLTENAGILVALAGAILLVVSLPASSSSPQPTALNLALGSLWPLPGIVVFSVGFGLNRYSKMAAPKVPPPRLTSEEAVYLKLYPAIQGMDYFEQHGVEVARTKALRNVAKAVESMSEWSAGDLAVSQRTLEPQLKDLRSNLRDRLLPALRSQEKSVVFAAFQILKQLGGYLVKAELRDLSQLNSAFAQLTLVQSLPERRVSYIGQHTVAGGAIVMSWAIVYLLGLRLGASIDTSYGSAVATAVGVLGAYLLYWWQRTKK